MAYKRSGTKDAILCMHSSLKLCLHNLGLSSEILLWKLHKLFRNISVQSSFQRSLKVVPQTIIKASVASRFGVYPQILHGNPLSLVSTVEYSCASIEANCGDYSRLVVLREKRYEVTTCVVVTTVDQVKKQTW